MRLVRITRSLLVLLLLAAVPLRTHAAAATDAPKFDPPKKFYLALGDSLAYGLQQAKFNAEYPNIDPTMFNTGYVDDFAAMLATVRPGIQTVNYACGGETTASFLTGGCPWLPLPLHNSLSGSQLATAVAFLAAHPGMVSPITIDIGANDVLGLVFGVCGGFQNTSCVSAGLPAVLNQVSVNLTQLLRALRGAAPDSEIIVLQYYNAFAVLDPSTSSVISALNGAIATAALGQRARLADAFTPFNLAQPQPATLCTLTLFCTPLQDVHASDAGYLVIAQQFWAASGYDRLGS
jgi:lysophospholipase L1-like esterase